MSLQILDAPLSKLFPDLFGISRPILTSEVPVLVAASMLTVFDSPMLPIATLGAAPVEDPQGIRRAMAVGGLPIFKILLETEPSEYYKVLWDSCTRIGAMIGVVDYEDTLGSLLKTYETTRYGDAKVEAPFAYTVITLNEVITLYKEKKLRCSATVKEIASPTISINPHATLIEAMQMMFDARVRRLFLKGTKNQFINSRNILSRLFSPKGLKVARDSPSSWVDIEVSAITPIAAHPVSPDATVQDVGSLVAPGRDLFILADGSSVASKWDLLLKPWKAGQLRLLL